MTNLEAIKGRLNYPLSSNSFILALTDRGLTHSDTYAKSQAFDLAYADAITTIVTTPNISEGGYSVSMSDKENLIKLANSIYLKYGEPSSLTPTARFVNRF
jgi:hypothetical protein